MENVRTRIADRLAVEIHTYLAGALPAGTGARDEVWEATADAGERMDEAYRAFERGEISFPEMEAEGVRYVEAWSDVVPQTLP